MDVLKIIAVHFLCIFVVAAAQGNEAVYCVLSEADSECVASSNLLSNLSSLAFITDERVHIYLSSGIHVLTENFNFSDTMKVMRLQGATNGEASNILCQNSSGLLFGNNLKTVILANINLEKCGRKYNYNTQLPAGIYFDNVEFFELRAISVRDCMGVGLSALNCKRLALLNCKFSNNVGGHGNITFKKYQRKTNISMDVVNSSFSNGSSNDYRSGLGIYIGAENAVSTITIFNTKFTRSMGRKGAHLEIVGYENATTIRVNVSNCTFVESDGPFAVNAHGVSIKSKDYINELEVVIQCSNFTNSKKGGLKIVHANKILVYNCLFNNNTGTGISITQSLTNIPADNPSNISVATIHIANTTFTKNWRALYLWLTVEKNSPYLQTTIFNCLFAHHNTPQQLILASATQAVVQIESNTQHKNYVKGYTNNAIHIERSLFKNNYDFSGDCSSLHVTNMNRFLISNSTFKNSNCTGITLMATTMTIDSRLSMLNNFGLRGGAIRLESKSVIVKNSDRSSIIKFSMIILKQDSTLDMHQNSALLQGGGIYSDESCDYRNEEMLCFIQFEEMPVERQLHISGNKAEKGGDSIFGGCLANCQLKFQNEVVIANAFDPKNIFYNLIMSSNFTSQSEVADYPKKVVFCGQFSDEEQCNDTHAVTVYRGQVFQLMLMVVDDSCIPSSSYIQTIIPDHYRNSLGLLKGKHYQSTKNCAMYSFALTGDSSLQSAMVKFIPQALGLGESSPSHLNVQLTECPTGYILDNMSCICNEALIEFGISCKQNSIGLQVPAFTWIGDNGGTAVSNYCRFCQTVKKMVENGSDELCRDQRIGVLCGSCSQGNSLLLGSYRCGKCNSLGHGVGLVLAFMFLGIALILLLLFLNITVASGVLNALIFYCNVIHFNTDIFMPFEIDSIKKTSLQTTVRYLSTILAWMNLDFGITTCFFNGYNTYISTWMQFVFPLYIWLLILLIVVASHYSRTVSRLTTSNTVPVLATLLMLSYAKLLTTSIGVVQFTTLKMLERDMKDKMVWFLDGNISYLGKKHAPLFLMSILTMLIYITPFTLLILLGPLLQANSERKVFRWINKLKPFLDAFYGPYTSSYRYWPGILLLARAALFICTIYSLGHTIFKLLSIATVTTLLILIWLLISQRAKTMIYVTKSKSYLEMSIFGNLALLSVAEAYLWSTGGSLHTKQIWAVTMTVITICCTLVYIVTIKCQGTQNVFRIIKLRLKKFKKEEAQTSNVTLNFPSHSTLELTESMVTSELREPLLSTELTQPL